MQDKIKQCMDYWADNKSLIDDSDQHMRIYEKSLMSPLLQVL
jgi:hypothetical protein